MLLSLYSAQTRALVPIREMARLIVECFKDPPWNEEWTETSATEIAQSLCAADFDLVLLQDDGSSRILAMALGMPLASYSDAAAMIAAGASPSSYYIPALATAKSFRRHGGCSRCLDRLLARAVERDFRLASLRTRHDNSQIFGVFRNFGFTEVGRMIARTGQVDSERVVFEKQLS